MGYDTTRRERAARMNRVPLLFVLLACLTLPTCSPAESPSDASSSTISTDPQMVEPSPGSPRDIAIAIDSSKPSLRTESKTGTAAGIDIRETRYYVGSTLVLIEEIVGSPEKGRSVTAYYFDDDRLAYFRGRGTRTVFVPGSAGTIENFDIEIGYDFDGNVVEAVKYIDGRPAEIEPLDFEAPKARARMLLEGEQGN